jgi:hypothetical protein
MRGKGAALSASILMCAVGKHEAVPPDRWAGGYYNRMPLPSLEVSAMGGFAVGWLDKLGLADTTSVLISERLACLSPVGVNILQQRLVAHLTRADIPTSRFWEAFGHTFEEADLLEEWIEELDGSESRDQVEAAFEHWIRSEDRQARLRDPQQRSSVRSAMRSELRSRSTETL